VTSPRTYATLAVACLALIGLATFRVASVNDQAQAINNRRGSVEEQLQTAVARLRELQASSDESRTAIFAAMDGLNEILNLGREAATLDEARGRWDAFAPVMEGARVAVVSLPRVTQEVVDVAGAGRKHAGRLIGVHQGEPRSEYFRLLDNALEVMSETHAVYGGLNARAIQGFALYEDLFGRSNEFFTKRARGDFRSPNEAADFYTGRTDSLVDPLAQLRAELQPLSEQATEAAARAQAAFRAADEKGKEVS
jgi:prefoldin subunit 5